jgi:prophage regulatory protein
MNDGRFPKPIRIGVRAVAWRKIELSHWLAERVSERDQRHREAA